MRIPPVIEALAREYQLTIHVNSLHGAEGIELRKQRDETDALICVGYYFYDLENAKIYRRVDSKRDIFFRSRLWFFWGWLVKPRIRDNQYKLLRTIPSSEFNEKWFVDVARVEFREK